MRPRRKWAIATLLSASAALVGCRGARGCLTGCGPGVGGGAAGSGNPGPDTPCPVVRMCPHVASVGAPASTQLGNENGNVKLGNVIETPLGPAVSYVAEWYQPGQPRQIGVVLPAQDESLAFDIQSAPGSDLLAPVVFQRDNELDLVGPPGYDQAIPITLDTFQAGTPIPLGIGPTSATMALAGVGQAMAALLNPGPTLRFYDATLSQPLISVSLANGPNSYSNVLALTPTCNGLLAHWDSHVQAFSLLGDQLAASVDINLHPLTARREIAVWDGGEVVISSGDGVVEVDSRGQVVSRTPVDMGVAVGTDDGLLSVGGGSSAEVRERKTGAVLESYDLGMTGIDPDLVSITTRYVYFMQSLMTSVVWFRVDCTA